MKKEQLSGGILGLCIGDALGVPYEGFSRKQMARYQKISIEKSPGIWSDDSSLTLCLAQSLTGGFNLKNIADKFVAWLEDGYLTPQGTAFGIGKTTRMAINNLKRGKDPQHSGLTGEDSNGNGSLMRILPLAYYCYHMEISKRLDTTGKVSAITHAHQRSVIACCIYIQLAVEILSGKNLIEAYRNMQKAIASYFAGDEQLPYYDRILNDDLSKVSRDNIFSGGYVVESLEASIWCLLNNSSYQDTVLEAIYLGHDTDTTAAQAGGLAGTYYGLGAIPPHWIKSLSKKEDVVQIAENLWESIIING